jgi:hypothetical protein
MQALVLVVLKLTVILGTAESESFVGNCSSAAYVDSHERIGLLPKFSQ